MRLDPFEKELHLPAASIQVGDRQGRQCKVVCQEDQPFPGLEILEADSPQRLLKTFVE